MSQGRRGDSDLGQGPPCMIAAGANKSQRTTRFTSHPLWRRTWHWDDMLDDVIRDEEQADARRDSVRLGDQSHGARSRALRNHEEKL
eukprot:1037904-Pyramimonas_sp.AAC.2